MWVLFTMRCLLFDGAKIPDLSAKTWASVTAGNFLIDFK
jgi:hypothetical protein